MADKKNEIDTKIDSSDAKKDIEELNKKLEGLVKNGLKVFKDAVVGGGKALTGLGVNAIKLASDLKEVQSIVDVTFGKNANEINDWAKNSAASFGMSEIQAKQLSGTMGVMLKSIGLTGDEAVKMSQSITGLAGDFASFYNIPLEEAFSKVRSGIGGETGALKELGINMSATNLEAFALSQGINTTYKEMTEAEQATLRYNYLMSMSKDVQGDFSRSSDSLSNQLKTAKLNMEGLSSDLGKLLLPIAEDAVKSFNDMAGKLREAFQRDDVQANIKRIAESIGSLISKIGELVAAWLPKIIEGFAWLLDHSSIIAAAIVGIGTSLMVLNTVIGVKNLIKDFKEAKVAAGAWAAIQKLLNFQLSINPITLIVAAIAGLIAAIVYLWNTNEGFRNAIIGAWNAILGVGKAVWGWIVNFFTVIIPQAWQSVLNFFSGIPGWFINLWTIIQQAFSNGWNAIVNFFIVTIPAWISQIFAWFSELPYKIGYALGYVLGTIIQWGINMLNYIITNVPIWISTIVNFFATLPVNIWMWLVNVVTNIVTWGEQIYFSMITSVTSTVNAVIQWFSTLPANIWMWLVNVFTNIVIWGEQIYLSMVTSVTNVVNAVIQWFSTLPANIWMWLVNAFTNIVTWGQQIYNSMVTSVTNAVNAVIQCFSTLPSNIWQWLSNTISQVIQFAANLGEQASQAGANMVRNIISAVQDLPSKMANIGKSVVEGVWNGITSMGSWIGDKISGFFTGLVDGAKDALKINSPSKVFRDQVGKSIAEGIGVGFEDETSNIEKSMEKDLSGLVRKMQMAVDYNVASTTAGIVASKNTSAEVGTVTNNNENGLNVNIESFVNNRKQDIREFAEELEFYRQKLSVGKGVV